MSILKRANQIVKGTLSEWLEQFETPELVLRQLLEELRQEKKQLAVQVQLCRVNEKRLELRAQDHQQKAEQWMSRARLAVDRGEDDLAREAIERRQEHAGTVLELTRQWETQHELLAGLEDALQLIERRYQEAERERRRLLEEHRIAEAQKQAAGMLYKLGHGDQMEAFASVREKLQGVRAEALATGSLALHTTEERFRMLDSAGSVERELLQLKLEAAPQPPGLEV